MEKEKEKEKEPEASGEEPARLGPYQLLEQVPQSEYTRGELYRATHETSGATALVLKPAAGDADGTGPRTDWRVSCISSASSGYFALEVEKSPWPAAPDGYSVETLVCTFENVREGMKRMDRALPTDDELRPRRRLGRVLAGAATVCALALVFALVHLAPESRPTAGPAAQANAETIPQSNEEPDPLFSRGALYDDTAQGQPVLARPLPSKPFKGQKRPPCTRFTEVELVGACWVPHELKAPCPDDLYEHQGKCYLPIYSVQPPPQSLEQ